jgi:type VI secretion system protein ImpK
VSAPAFRSATAAALAVATHGGDPLLAQFGEFYTELLRIKSALAVGGRRVGRSDGLNVADVSEAMHRHLRNLLERQAARARQWGGAYGQALYAEAEYVMAALADETLLLRVEWGGSETWQYRLLETALFGTSLAGERVFERLDALLADPARAHPSLATLYLIALALGFRGRYWRDEDDARLRLYRTALAGIITRSVPDVGEIGPRLFSQAYASTVERGRPVRLPGLRPWLTAVAALTAVFLLGSYGLWRVATADLERAIAGIERPLAAAH